VPRLVPDGPAPVVIPPAVDHPVTRPGILAAGGDLGSAWEVHLRVTAEDIAAILAQSRLF
jgi:hypothetical protein